MSTGMKWWEPEANIQSAEFIAWRDEEQPKVDAICNRAEQQPTGQEILVQGIREEMVTDGLLARLSSGEVYRYHAAVNLWKHQCKISDESEGHYGPSNDDVLLTTDEVRGLMEAPTDLPKTLFGYPIHWVDTLEGKKPVVHPDRRPMLGQKEFQPVNWRPMRFDRATDQWVECSPGEVAENRDLPKAMKEAAAILCKEPLVERKQLGMACSRIEAGHLVAFNEQGFLETVTAQIPGHWIIEGMATKSFDPGDPVYENQILRRTPDIGSTLVADQTWLGAKSPSPGSAAVGKSDEVPKDGTLLVQDCPSIDKRHVYRFNAATNMYERLADGPIPVQRVPYIESGHRGASYYWYERLDDYEFELGAATLEELERLLALHRENGNR